jgi:hypothetical protein
MPEGTIKQPVCEPRPVRSERLINLSLGEAGTLEAMRKKSAEAVVFQAHFPPYPMKTIVVL